MVEKNENTKVSKLIEQRNKIDAQIQAIENKIVDKNTRILIEEVMNLIDGVGDGYVPGDYYAEDRYYSKIPGVKNIRFNEKGNIIFVKVVSPAGYLLPNEITVRGKKYKVMFYRSKHYSNAMDY